MTYTALSVLKTLGDDLGRLYKRDILEGLFTILLNMARRLLCFDLYSLWNSVSICLCLDMWTLQQPNGSFSASRNGNESDMRFLYCACAISHIVDDWSGINIESAVRYVLSCVTYEGGISLTPGKCEAILSTIPTPLSSV